MQKSFQTSAASTCLLVSLLLTSSCSTFRSGSGSRATSDAPASSRPAKWAQPLSSPGLPNLHQVSDDIYRSAQPTAEGYLAAHQLGIRSVLRLRVVTSRHDPAAAGLKVFDLPFNAWSVNDDVVLHAMRILSHAHRDGPFLVHCQHGADRTGLIVAMYRIIFEDWPREDAIAELTEGDFGFHPIFVNIPQYIRTVDIEKFKELIKDWQ